MFNFMRKLPHPKYGKCGGASRDCSPKNPVDKMDDAFLIHDVALYNADQMAKEKRKAARKKADKELANSLRSIDPKNLGIWGRIYRRMAMMVFR